MTNPPDLDEILAELASLEDPAMRAANEKRGDDHGINLSALRAVAQRVKANHSLALSLWATGQTPARLLALLVCRPKQFTADELDAMLRERLAPKTRDWFLNYVAKKSPHAEELRLRWLGSDEPAIDAAGWVLTSDRVWRRPDGLDLEALLIRIEREMKDAPRDQQWAMNETLAQIGIHHPALRARAIEIGERLQVLADYPTARGCTSPFAPAWIAEMVRRQQT
ncbi:MAG: DNA alkylation repair protein [Arachnia sp.]